jgi:hypothetical protein
LQKRAGRVAQDVGPEFKTQYHTHKKNLTGCGSRGCGTMSLSL